MDNKQLNGGLYQFSNASKLEWTNHAMLTTLQVAWCVTWVYYVNISEDATMTSGTEWCKPMTTMMENDTWTSYLHWLVARHVFFLTQKYLMPKDLVWCTSMTMVMPHDTKHDQTLHIDWLCNAPYYEHQNIMCATRHY